MSFFSQTGSAIASSNDNQITAPNTERDSGVILHTSPNTVFRIAGSMRIVTDIQERQIKDISSIELSPEEEDKFYKKVFKTSLI